MTDKEIPYATGSRAIAAENAKTVSAIKKVAKQIRQAASEGNVNMPIYFKNIGIDNANCRLIETALTDKGFKVESIIDVFAGSPSLKKVIGFEVSW